MTTRFSLRTKLFAHPADLLFLRTQVATNIWALVLPGTYELSYYLFKVSFNTNMLQWMIISIGRNPPFALQTMKKDFHAMTNQILTIFCSECIARVAYSGAKFSFALLYCPISWKVKSLEVRIMQPLQLTIVKLNEASIINKEVPQILVTIKL